MTVDTSMKTIIAAASLVIVIPATFFFWKIPPADLKDTEKELIMFSSQPLVISSPKPQPAFSGLDFPVRAAAKKQPTAVLTGVKSLSPPVTSATEALKARRRISFDSRPVVSMLYTEGYIKTAIIDRRVLHEGSVLGKYQVVKIEKNRVMMRAGGKDIWLNIE